MRRLWIFASVFAGIMFGLTTKLSEQPTTTIKMDSVVNVIDSKHIVQDLLWVEEMGVRPVSDSLVSNILTVLKVEHPHIVHAQMRLESGHYTSRLARDNHNYFGMKHPAQRFTLSLGKKNGYASYRNWVYSIVDYALWQKRYASSLTEEEYLAYLAKVYASDKDYTTKIKRIANTLKES
jgi:hypothetical protein